MEWAKAKNLEIFLLIVVNLILLLLNALQGNEYILTGSAQSSIKTLLSNNNIQMNCSVPREYSPMRNLLLKPVEIDVEKLRGSMFSAADIVTRSVEIGKVTLMSDYSILTVEDNFIYYNSSSGRTFLDEQITQYDLDTIKRYSQNIVSKTDFLFSDIVLDTVTEKNDTVKLTYYEVYKGNKILDSYIKVIVTEDLNVSIEIVVYSPQFFVDFYRDICSSDEALFTLIPAVKNKNTPAIEKIDIVYSVESSGTEMNTEIKSTPYYRIFVTGIEKPYLINAYTNRIKLEGEQYFHE